MLDKLFALDIFGVEYSLREKGRTKFHTKFSLLISILTIIASIVISILFGIEIFINKLPTVNSGQINIDFNETKIHYKDFAFMIEIVNADTFEYLDFEQYFELQTIDYNPKGAEVFKSNITRCNSTIIEENYNFLEYFENKVGNYFCFKMLEDFIYSDGLSDNGRFLISRIRKCDLSKNDKCQDIFKKNPNVSVFIYYLEPVINAQNYKNVISYRKSYVKFRISKNSYYDTIFNLRNDQIETDKGKVFEDKSIDNYVAIDKIWKDIVLKEESNPLLINFIVMTTNVRTLIERRYMKFQDLFAKIGGFYNALYI